MRLVSIGKKSKGKFKRTRAYRSEKRTPEISNPKEVKKVLFDPELEDLTDKINLSEIVMDDPAPFKGKQIKEIRTEIVKDIVEGLVDLGKDLKPTKEKRPVYKKDGSSVCVLFSDWHFGKVIKTRAGKFIYNTDIATERVANLKKQIVEYVNNLEASGSVIDEIVIIFAGDIVDNDIVYDTQRFRIDNPVGLQFHTVIRSIMSMISDLHSYGKTRIPIRLECVVGNHGRASSMSKIGLCSWDTAVYSALDLAIKNSYMSNKVSVSFSLEEYKIINVRGHRGLITHQAPAQSETPSAKKKFGGWYEIFDYDFCCYGDLHHWGASSYNGRPLLMNGSLCGYDEFAIKIGVRDEWAQLIWCVTDKTPVKLLDKLSD